VASRRAVTAKWGSALKLGAAAALGLGLAHCSTDLGDLMGGGDSESNNPLGETPGWSRPYPGEPAPPGGGEIKAPGEDPGSDPTPEELINRGRWCSGQQVTFCVDFDEEAPLARFGAGVEGQVFPVLNAGFDVSAPYAMLVDVPETLNRDDAFVARITHHFGQRVGGFRLDFQFSPELVSDQNVATIAAVDFAGNALAAYSLRLAYEGGVLYLNEVRQGVSRRLSSTVIEAGEQRWSHLSLDADFGAMPKATFRLVNDAEKTETVVGLSLLDLPADMSTVPSLVLGVVDGQRPHNGWKLRYDNVSLNLR
jgi:hypothetical protein